MRTVIVALLLFVLLSPPARGGWQTNGVPVSDAASIQNYPVAVPDGSGGAIFAWVDGRSGSVNGEDIYMQRVDASGTAQWAEDGVVICNSARASRYFVEIISDGAGGAIIAWEEWRDDDRDIYAQRIDAFGVPQWTSNGVAVSSAPNDQAEPKMISNGSGGAVLVWTDLRNLGPTGFDIYAARVTAAGTVVDPAGIPVDTAPESQWGPSLSPFGTGGAIIAWHDGGFQVDSNIYATRMTGLGAVLDPGLVVCNDTAHQANPVCVSDGSGGAIIGWADYRSPAGIYAQRMTDLGTMAWTPNGVLASNAESVDSPHMIADGAGGAFIAWSTGSGSDYDLYAQRINSSGARQWLPNDTPICVTTDEYPDLRIATDNAGGILAAWKDPRDGQHDIYAQRLSSTGSLQWPVNGALVCGDEFPQGIPAVVSDGVGGAIVAWLDCRTDPSYCEEGDIYAQHVLPDGQLPTSVGRTPSAMFTVRDAFPNPFAGSTDLRVSLHEDADVTIAVYDVMGRRVRSFARLQAKAGEMHIRFDGRDQAGSELPSGVYFSRVTVAGVSESRKLVILR